MPLEILDLSCSVLGYVEAGSGEAFSLLLVDGASFLLLSDGTSKLLLVS